MPSQFRTEYLFVSMLFLVLMYDTLSHMFASVVAELQEMDDDQFVEHFRTLELEQRRHEAVLAAAVADAERRGVHRRDGHHTIRNWLRAEVNWSGAQIVRRRRVGRLITDMAEVGAALHDGLIGVAQADELARARANPRCGDQLADAIDVLLEHCEQLPFDDSRACVQRWEILADLDGSHRDRVSSEERRVAFVGEDDGGVFINASGGSALDAAEMTTIFDTFVEQEFRNDVIGRTERHGPDAPTSLLSRTDAQRRFDAMHTIFRAAAANANQAPPIPMVVNLVCDQWTFDDVIARHGLGEAPIDDGVRSDPAERRCETDTGTPLLPDDALRAALDGHIRRVVIDSDGIPINFGRKRRLFTGAAREAARLLAKRCEGPGCTVKKRFAQIDHLHEHADGGDTDIANAGVDCGRHNRLKSKNGLVAVRRPDGQLNWYRRDGTQMSSVGRRHVPDLGEIAAATRRRIDELHDLRSDRSTASDVDMVS